MDDNHGEKSSGDLHDNALPRLLSTDVVVWTDEDWEAYGAMLHAMTPREDRKD